MISRMGWQKAKTRARYRTIIAIFKPTTWTTDGHIFSTLCHYLSQCDVESDEAHFNEEMQHNAFCCCYWCTTLVNNLDVMIIVVVNTLSMIIMITTLQISWSSHHITIILMHHSCQWPTPRQGGRSWQAGERKKCLQFLRRMWNC